MSQVGLFGADVLREVEIQDNYNSAQEREGIDLK